MDYPTGKSPIVATAIRPLHRRERGRGLGLAARRPGGKRRGGRRSAPDFPGDDKQPPLRSSSWRRRWRAPLRSKRPKRRRRAAKRSRSRRRRSRVPPTLPAQPSPRRWAARSPRRRTTRPSPSRRHRLTLPGGRRRRSSIRFPPGRLRSRGQRREDRARFVSAAKDHVQTVAGSIARDASEKIASAVRGTAATASPLTDRLTTGTADSSPGPSSPQPAQPVRRRPCFPHRRIHLKPEVKLRRTAHSASPNRRPASSQPWSPIPVGWAARASTRLVGAQGGDDRICFGIRFEGARRACEGPAHGRRRGGRPLRRSRTLWPCASGHPAAGPAPGAIAPASGDSLFVPFVALLALLALVAPASTAQAQGGAGFPRAHPLCLRA